MLLNQSLLGIRSEVQYIVLKNHRNKGTRCIHAPGRNHSNKGLFLDVLFKYVPA